MPSRSRPRPLPYGVGQPGPAPSGRGKRPRRALTIYAKGYSWFLCGVVPSGLAFFAGATRCMPVLFDTARTEIAIARPQAARARVEGLGARSRRGPNTFCRASDLVDGPPMSPACSVRPAKEANQPLASGDSPILVVPSSVFFAKIDSQARPCRFSAFLCIKRGLFT